MESITIIFSTVIKRFMQSKERFSIECRQTKTKVIKRPIEAEEYTPKLQEKKQTAFSVGTSRWPICHQV